MARLRSWWWVVACLLLAVWVGAVAAPGLVWSSKAPMSYVITGDGTAKNVMPAAIIDEEGQHVGIADNPLPVRIGPAQNFVGYLTSSGLSSVPENIGNSTAIVWGACALDAHGCTVHALRVGIVDTTHGNSGSMATLGAQAGATGLRVRVRTSGGVDVSTLVDALPTNASLLAWCPSAFEPRFGAGRVDIACVHEWPGGLDLEAGQQIAADSRSALGASVNMTVHIDGVAW